VAEDSQAECGSAADAVEAVFCDVSNLADSVGAQVGKFCGFEAPDVFDRIEAVAAIRGYVPEFAASEDAKTELGAHQAISPATTYVSIAASCSTECLAVTRLARRAIATALISQVSIVSGGPGVGKTTSVRVRVELLEQRGVPYVLISPTGEAAKRLAEATLHDALHYSPPVVQPRSAPPGRGARSPRSG
jgi:hypothetical protein